MAKFELDIDLNRYSPTSREQFAKTLIKMEGVFQDSDCYDCGMADDEIGVCEQCAITLEWFNNVFKTLGILVG